MSEIYANGNTNTVFEYAVEEIIDKQVNPLTGLTEYLLKRKGYKDSTWEPEHYLNCPSLVAEFEANRRRTHNGKINYTDAVTNDAYKYDEEKKPIGFARGFQPEKILAATNSSGQLLFLMKWANARKVDLVTAEEANDRCPQVVVDFYKKHTVLWNVKDASQCNLT